MSDGRIQVGMLLVDIWGQALTDSQIDILERVVAAARQLPGNHVFECRRVDRYPFAWLIHDGFGKGVVMAAWEDLEAIERAGLIHMTSHDPGDCSFELAAKATQLDVRQIVARGSVQPPLGEAGKDMLENR